MNGFIQRLQSSLSHLLDGEDQPAVLIAISSGADSTALLRAACAISGLQVSAAHVNHKLRGAESDADEQFCRELCAQLNVEFYATTLEGLSRDEATLRDGRYAALIETAKEHGFAAIATAHTLDDQIETMLFRLFRGTSPLGLQAIPKRRSLAEHLDLVRPMLQMRRSEVLSYLASEGAQFRSDSSNLSNEYARNFIRNELLPLIQQRFGDVVPKLDLLRSLLVEDEYVLAEMTETRAAVLFDEHGSAPLVSFLTQPIALQRRIIAEELKDRQLEVSSERVEAIRQLALAGGKICLSPSWHVACFEGELRFLDVDNATLNPAEFSDSAYLPVELRSTGLTLIPQLGCAIKLTTCAQQSPMAEFPGATALEAYAKLTPSLLPLSARRRKPGDRITPFGMTESVRLKRYLQTHRKADGSHAGNPVVVMDASDEIVWVPGVGISNKLAVDEYPTHHMQFLLVAADESGIA